MNGVDDLAAIAVATEGEGGDAGLHVILSEIGARLERLLEHGAGGAIDLRAMPLAPGALARLREVLARGEVEVTVDALGESTIFETAYPGVWWSTHRNVGGEVVAEHIEVTFVPAMIASDPDDVRRGVERLREQVAAARGPAGAAG